MEGFCRASQSYNLQVCNGVFLCGSYFLFLFVLTSFFDQIPLTPYICSNFPLLPK